LPSNLRLTIHNSCI